MVQAQRKRLTFIDLFAGAGGLSIGLELAGLDAMAAVEMDTDAAETYRSWHSTEPRLSTGRTEPKVHETDLGSVNLQQYVGQVDLVAGGPPCQPWSLGGLRQGHADPRDGLILFRDAVHTIRPRAFLMENVAGLCRGSARSPFEDFVASFDTKHWDIDYKVLQAADYGVPQKRTRLFVIGVPKGSEWSWPEPRFGTGTGRPWMKAGRILRHEVLGSPNPSIVTYAKAPSLRPSPYHGQVYNGGGRPIDLTEPAPTLLASMGGNKTPWIDTLGVVPGYHRHLSEGGAPRTGTVPGARRISIDEAAALQTFPRSVKFAGKRSSQYRQVGNAVPPRLAAFIGRALKRALATTPR